jgi:membrane protease YdiL (CAAX protease family)
MRRNPLFPGCGTTIPGRICGFVLLLLLYQSAEGLGDRWLHSFAVQAGLMLLALFTAWPVAHALGWPGRRWLEAYALEPRQRAPTLLLLGVLLAVALKFVAIAAGLHWSIYRDAGPAAPPMAMLTGLPWMLLATFVPSVTEDILTRGYLYRAAGFAWRKGATFVLASSALYVLNHVYRLHLGPREWLLLFAYGVVCATALWRTGSLWSAVGLHWGWNLGNELASSLFPTQTMDANGAALLSIGAHAIMLLAVLTRPVYWRA